MTLVYACIAPHGSETINRITSKRTQSLFRKTQQGMNRLGSQITSSRPDTIVIATPHNLRILRHICVVTSENSSGKLAGENKSVRLKVKCDVKFSRQLMAEASRRGLPVVGANYGSAEGETSDMPMDGGTLVPLWFVLNRKRRHPRVVIVTPSREIPLA